MAGGPGRQQHDFVIGFQRAHHDLVSAVEKRDVEHAREAQKEPRQRDRAARIEHEFPVQRQPAIAIGETQLGLRFHEGKHLGQRHRPRPDGSDVDHRAGEGVVPRIVERDSRGHPDGRPGEKSQQHERVEPKGRTGHA